MQVSQINSTNFNSKQRFLNEKGFNNLKAIREKIGKASVVSCGDEFFQIKTGYLEADKVFYMNIEPAEVLIGKSLLRINDNGSVDILKKPFFRSKAGLMNVLEKYLAAFNNDFYNRNIVKFRNLIETGYIDECDGKAYIIKKEWV